MIVNSKAIGGTPYPIAGLHADCSSTTRRLACPLDCGLSVFCVGCFDCHVVPLQTLCRILYGLCCKRNAGRTARYHFLNDLLRWALESWRPTPRRSNVHTVHGYGTTWDVTVSQSHLRTLVSCWLQLTAVTSSNLPHCAGRQSKLKWVVL